MKREDIEKAAKDYTIGKTHFRRNVLKEVDADDYVYARIIAVKTSWQVQNGASAARGMMQAKHHNTVEC